MEDCIFCKIINNKVDRNLVYEDSKVVIFKSIKPSAEHHLLIVPKKHTISFLELNEDILAMTKAAQNIIKKLNLAEGYKLIFNGGKYLEIMHVHWHLLAGKLEDTNDILDKI